MNRRIGRAQALAGVLAVTAAAMLATTAPAAADTNPNVQVSTLAQPESDDALLNILTEQGVNYEPVTDAISAFNAGGPDATLVIDEDESLSRNDLDLLSSANFARIILLTQDPGTLDEFFPGADISTSQTNASADIAAACTEPNDMATSAGAIESPGPLFTYALPDKTTGQACYPVGGSPSMVELHSGPDGGVPGGTDMILLGSTAFLENQYLADDGNADLAMRIFGAHQTLVWLATTFTNDSTLDCQNTQCTGGGDGSGANGGGNGNGGNGGGTTTTVTPQPGQNTASQPTLGGMLPSWIWWVLAQIVLAVLLFAYWRARRQGRIVAEPLPVTVRAAETVEGHARLYRRAGAFGHSARLLRQASAGRLAPVFGLPQARAEADPRLLVGPIATRLGTDPARVGGLLAGPDPTSEAELVLLADHLDQLEQEVRSS